MKERPILFNAEMVRAVLDGRKTQTRRVIKPQSDVNDRLELSDSDPSWFFLHHKDCEGACDYDCGTFDSPYGKPGDELWVRETFFAWGNWERYYDAASNKFRNRFVDNTDDEHPIKYRATDGRPNHDFYGGPANGGDDYHKRPSIFMPRWASRIQLRITDVRVERVQEITGTEVMAEGGPPDHVSISRVSRDFRYESWLISWFAQLWNSINEKRGYGWDKNPWVWVVEFEVVK